jgi:hypothetical protein
MTYILVEKIDYRHIISIQWHSLNEYKYIRIHGKDRYIAAHINGGAVHILILRILITLIFGRTRGLEDEGVSLQVGTKDDDSDPRIWRRGVPPWQKMVGRMFENIFLLVFRYLTRHKSIERHVRKLRDKLAPYWARQKVVSIVNSYRANIFVNMRRIHLRHLCKVANGSDELFTKYTKDPHR